MKLHFLYSINKEKEKLLNIYEEYQWFINKDFDIILPKFFDTIYHHNKNSKTIFIKEVNKKLDKIYQVEIYQQKKEVVRNNWQKIENDFFAVIKDLKFKIRDKYFCHISLYGPQGQFNCPNIVNLRANTDKDIKEANETIAHELIHLLIFDKAKKLKLDYKQTEGMVDLFFEETCLKNIFPNYHIQNIAEHDKNLFQKNITNN